MKQLAGFLLFTLLIVWTGCASVRVYDVQPSFHRISNDDLDVLLEPQPAAGHYYFNSFRLVLQNKTDKPMEIDWFDTYYLLNGQKNGRFGWDGMTFTDLEALRNNPYSTVGPGQTLTAVIFPLKLLASSKLKDTARLGGPGPEGQLALGPLPAGHNGMMLLVVQNERRIQETLSFDVSERALRK
jgi:hypothetical protein